MSKINRPAIRTHEPRTIKPPTKKPSSSNLLAQKSDTSSQVKSPSVADVKKKPSVIDVQKEKMSIAAQDSAKTQRNERVRTNTLPSTDTAASSVLKAKLNSALKSNEKILTKPKDLVSLPNTSKIAETRGGMPRSVLRETGLNRNQDVAPPEGTDVKEGVIDLSKPISVRGVQTAIDAIANERGESGSVGLHLEGAGRVGGAVTVGGSGDLGLSVAKADTGATTLSFNYEAAVKAGFDVGFMKGEGSVGVNGSAKVRFNNSADAAAWVTKNLHNINQKADGKLFQIDDSKFNYQKPTVIRENGAFLEGKVSTKFGPFEVEASGRRQSTSQTFKTPDGKTYNGKNTESIASVNGTMDFGKFKVNGKYEFTGNTQTGDPVGENNGTYRNHKVSFDVPFEKMKTMSKKDIRSAIVGLTMMNEVGTPGELRGITDKALDKIVNNIDHIVKNPPEGGLKGSIGITYEANNVKEGDKYNNQYQRLYLDLKGGYEASADLGIGKGKFSADVSKSEKLAEWTGANTESYSSQVYNRSTDPNGNRPDWDQFKKDNQGTLESIIQKRVDANPKGDVAKAYNGDGGYNAGLDALEKDWASQKTMDQGLRGDAEKLANIGNSVWTSSGDEGKLLNILSKYEEQPEKMSKLLDYMGSQGLTRDQLMSGTGGYFSGNDEQLQKYFNIADQYKAGQ